MLDSGVLLIDTRFKNFTIRDIRNRRFMYAPYTGELILGKQYRGSKLYASHAAEHEETETTTPFDRRPKNHILQSIIACGKLELQNKTEDKKMAYSIDVAAARALATKAHEGQTDKAGLPYITHPERVALRMESPELQVIGWLHDTVEDTPIALQDI